MRDRFFFLFVLFGLLFTSQAFADTTPPVTTFSSFQVPNTTDQNITLTCTDNNTGCKAINYNINNEGWLTGYGINPFYNDTNLILYYDFDEETGTTVIDSKNDYNGINTNAILGLIGKNETSYEFNGTDSNVKTIGVNGGTQNTFSGWVYAYDSTPATEETLFGYVRAGGSGGWNMYTIRLNTNGKIHAIISSTSAHTVYRTDVTLDTNTWHLITQTFNDADNNVCLYVDNVGKCFSIAYTPPNNRADLEFGTNIIEDIYYFSGRLDEFSYWDKSLTSSEVNQIYNSGSGLFYDATSLDNFSFLYSGAGSDHNIQYYSTDNSDNNETIKTSNFTTYGLLRLNFFDDTTKTGLDEVYLEFNGTPYYSDSNSFIYVDLNDLTSGSKTILLQRTDYQEKSFSLNLNQFSDLNYQIGFIKSSNISEVNFQVFTETGTLKPNTSFTATDNDNDYLIDIKTTDSQGRITFYLNNQKSDYNFVSTDLNFGTTTWTINKPKNASTLDTIDGNWKYSITGPSYSSQTNISSGVEKILLQNTVNPYFITIQDVAESYAESRFGLKSVTGEDTRTLNPYLYPIESASLVLTKLLDFASNQPISEPKELELDLYTDSNGLINIGTYVNDSTGTYNIYMDANEQYKLTVEGQSFILNPTLNLYYLYLTSNVGLDLNNEVSDVNGIGPEFSTPEIVLEVREFFFGCSTTEENCYNSMIFSLIALVLIAIGLAGVIRLSPLEQTVINMVLLSVFTYIQFIPLWLFGVGMVIIIAWGVFS